MWFFLYIFIFFSLWFFLHLKFFNIITSYCLQTIFFLSLSIVYLHLIIVMTSQWNNKVINYINWSIKKNANFLVWFLVHVKLKFYVEKYAAIQSFRVHSFEKQWDCRKRYIWLDIFFGLVFFLTYTYYNYYFFSLLSLLMYSF